VKRWKIAEKKAAEAFGVERVVRMNFGVEGPDVTEHDVFGIEVKSRKRFPSFVKSGLEQAKKYFPDKLPLVVVDIAYWKEQMVIMKMEDFQAAVSVSRSDLNLDAILEISKDPDGSVNIKVK